MEISGLPFGDQAHRLVGGGPPYKPVDNSERACCVMVVASMPSHSGSGGTWFVLPRRPSSSLSRTARATTGCAAS